MSKPRMIRGWIAPGAGPNSSVTQWSVWKEPAGGHNPVVIVPASYVDAVEALVAQVEEIASTVAASWIDDALRTALQQFREATEGDEDGT